MVLRSVRIFCIELCGKLPNSLQGLCGGWVSHCSRLCHFMYVYIYFFIFRYDPYSKVLSREYYEQPLMKQTRKAAIDRASEAKVWGLIFSTLGHQGSHKVRENIMVSWEKILYFVTGNDSFSFELVDLC